MKTKTPTYWAAVKVLRGYVEEVRLFESFAAAAKAENRWRPLINPDYDEVAVVKARVRESDSPSTTAPRRR